MPICISENLSKSQPAGETLTAWWGYISTVRFIFLSEALLLIISIHSFNVSIPNPGGIMPNLDARCWQGLKQGFPLQEEDWGRKRKSVSSSNVLPWHLAFIQGACTHQEYWPVFPDNLQFVSKYLRNETAVLFWLFFFVFFRFFST